jgi:hypothetical protein
MAKPQSFFTTQRNNFFNSIGEFSFHKVWTLVM